MDACKTETDATAIIKAWLEGASDRLSGAIDALDAYRTEWGDDDAMEALRDYVSDSMREDFPSYMDAIVLAWSQECDIDALLEWVDECTEW